MKKFLALLLALCMVFALAACGGGNDEPKPSAEPTDPGVQTSQDVGNIDNTYVKDEMVLGVATSATLTPWGTKNGVPGNYEVYEMLYECDAKGEMYPVLADATYEGTFMPGCDHEAGTGVYIVKIYDYIKDHEGRAITAEDVAFSFLHQLNNESTSGWKDNLQTVEAVDATTVKFTFATEQTNVGQLLNVFCRCFIVSKDQDLDKLATEMCGTGPYKFVSYTSGSELKLEKNEAYWQTNEDVRPQESQANVNKITYKFIDESSQLIIGLKTGELDLATGLGLKDIAAFADGGEYDEQFNVFSYPAKFVQNIVANCSEDSIMSDINMRLAVFNAIDQDALVEALGGSTRIYSYASGYYTDYSWVDYESMDNYNTRTSVDPAVVKDYLDKAGYKGETIKILAGNMVSDAAAIVEGMLRQQGMEVSLQVLDPQSANNVRSDTKGWDLEFSTMAGDFNVTVWQHGFSYGNVATKDHTMYYQVDQEWEDLLNKCLTDEGHTPENMQAWWEHCVENAYAMGVYTGTDYVVIPADMTYFVQGDKLTALSGASTYADPEA